MPVTQSRSNRFADAALLVSAAALTLLTGLSNALANDVQTVAEMNCPREQSCARRHADRGERDADDRARPKDRVEPPQPSAPPFFPPTAPLVPTFPFLPPPPPPRFELSPPEPAKPVHADNAEAGMSREA